MILGDSATAHFHVPPQWVTSQGWNLDGLLKHVENELDMPMCSWGTGHASPEECPYQHPVPGLSGVTSLYSQLSERNRCNTNDYQNIGVNGARITSSMGLVDALARDVTLDHPALVWLALIGNDVCSGHQDFDHMTKPEEFYTYAMASLTALDKKLAKGSHVVALALFDGEYLFDIMHDLQHPIGMKYSELYDYMNCLEENPCWGWLNSDAEIRRKTTWISTQQNEVYRNISKTATFENFEFIFHSPVWADIATDFVKAGGELVNIIEPVDGFHPSQTGNAIFAQKFWQWLEEFHPAAIGPINKYNDEINDMFFNGAKV